MRARPFSLLRVELTRFAGRVGDFAVATPRPRPFAGYSRGREGDAVMSLTDLLRRISKSRDRPTPAAGLDHHPPRKQRFQGTEPKANSAARRHH
jgi:hypothetical protein